MPELSRSPLDGHSPPAVSAEEPFIPRSGFRPCQNPPRQLRPATSPFHRVRSEHRAPRGSNSVLSWVTSDSHRVFRQDKEEFTLGPPMEANRGDYNWHLLHSRSNP